MYEATRKVFWTGVRISPPPPKRFMEQAIHFVMEFYQVSREDAINLYWDEVEATMNLFDGGVIGFDKATSTEVDNSTQRVVKSKSSKCKR